ncbi:hypothetical protein C8R45DRAFT_824215 [Mycena sanguinolenta]|nr:hypothetical protein C8R45DRAFT_824215 [Mycena sanguinolenta]
MLHWAVSLLGFAYSFINFRLQEESEKPPFEIPTICFVHGGLAVAHTGSHTHAKTSLSRTWLVEELLNLDEDNKFYKFINNGHAVPSAAVDLADDPVLTFTTEFLCFIQHIQYWKTGGMVYISDLQGDNTGTTPLLTDPQIMTSPSIAERKNLFGGGNDPDTLRAFPSQHVCNKFCWWFKLPTLSETGSQRLL